MNENNIIILSPARTASTLTVEITKELINKTQYQGVYKTHNTNQKFNKGILCIRDPFYAISSFIRFVNGISKRPLEEFEELKKINFIFDNRKLYDIFIEAKNMTKENLLSIDLFPSLIDEYKKWVIFYESNIKNPNLLILRYEKYITNPIKRIEDIANFLKIDICRNDMSLINQRNSINKNKQKSKANKILNPRILLDTLNFLIIIIWSILIKHRFNKFKN